MRRAGLAFGALLFLQFSGCHKQVVKSFPLPSDTMTSQSATPAPDSVAAAAPATPLPATPAAPGVPLDTAAIVTAPVAEAAPLNCRVPRNTVRVILLQSRSPVAVSLTGAFLWYYNAEKGGNVSGAAHAEYRSGTLSFSGRKVRLSEGRAAACVPLDAASRFTVNGNNYRGGLVFRAAKSGALSIINDVAVEDYLRGVLPYEIGVRDSNLFEALKVQAVVARTYTYARLNSHADEGYDMFADQSDQVYNGVKGEYRLSDRAVSETRDEVVTCNDSLIQAFYFSTSSGNTANIEEVWPDRGFRPYLRSVPDAAFNAGAKYESWTERWPGPALSAIVNQGLREAIADFQKGVVTDIAVQDTFACGRVRSLLVTVSGKTYTVTGDRTRWILRRNQPDRPILQSAYFRLAIDRNTNGTLSGLTAFGRGFGHGVGLSQMGAIGMAKAGKNAEEIIRAYYTGVRLAKVVY